MSASEVDSDDLSQESHLRSFAKGITWRVTATTTTILIALAVTGHVGSAFAIGGSEFVVKILVYYCHERLWQRVPRGTIRSVARKISFKAPRK